MQEPRAQSRKRQERSVSGLAAKPLRATPTPSPAPTDKPLPRARALTSNTTQNSAVRDHARTQWSECAAAGTAQTCWKQVMNATPGRPNFSHSTRVCIKCGVRSVRRENGLREGAVSREASCAFFPMRSPYTPSDGLVSFIADGPGPMESGRERIRHRRGSAGSF